jgi:hypothetical protein
VRRSKLLAGAALAASLAAGCKREPAPEPPDILNGPTLDAPAPSSTMLKDPLAAGASTYTNEMQAENLRDEAAKLGIDGLTKPSFPAEDDSPRPHRTITYQEGIERTLGMTRNAEAARHAIEGDKNKSVALPTETPDMLPANKAGAPIDSPTGDAAGSKGP